MYTHICIYTYIERERESYNYIYIYIYTCIHTYKLYRRAREDVRLVVYIDRELDMKTHLTLQPGAK